MKSCESCKYTSNDNIDCQHPDIIKNNYDPEMLCVKFGEYGWYEPKGQEKVLTDEQKRTIEFYNNVYFKEQTMSLFEKNLEVLKESGGDFSKIESIDHPRYTIHSCTVNLLVEDELRIKPQPVSRPFKPEEITDEFIGKIVKHKKDMIVLMITGYDFNTIKVGSHCLFFDSAFKDYTWQDGSVFGITEGL